MPKSGSKLKPVASPVVLALTIPETSAALRICRTKVYDAINAGLLDSYRVGKARRVTIASIQTYQARLIAEERAPRLRR
jgi:excisionase family DNA binding protein